MTTLSSSALPNDISSIQTDINELNNKILVLENKILGMENEISEFKKACPGIDRGIGDYEERVRSSYSMKIDLYSKAMDLLLKYQDKQNLLIGRLSQGMYVYMNSKLVRKIIIYIAIFYS